MTVLRANPSTSPTDGVSARFRMQSSSGTWTCDHLFVKDVDTDLVEEVEHRRTVAMGSGINDIVILRWFPETPVPSEVG